LQAPELPLGIAGIARSAPCKSLRFGHAREFGFKFKFKFGLKK